MRAFMSERTNRPSWGTFEAPPDTRNMTWAEIEVCTAQAEREVRAILAVTEGPLHHLNHPDRNYSGHYGIPRDPLSEHGVLPFTRAILAEALPTFIAFIEDW